MRGARAAVVLVTIALGALTSFEAVARQAGGLGSAGAPEASLGLRCASALALLLGALCIAAWLLRRETARGRGSPLPAGEIDSAWLERHLFTLPPELVGALYDRRVAWPEVAAVMARMSVESKIVSRVATGARGWNNLELWLLVEREELAGYERDLVESLFLSRNVTSSDAIQETYKSTGFDPARLLEQRLKAQADELLGIGPALTWPLWLGLGASALLLVLTLAGGAAGLLPGAAALLSTAAASYGALRFAARWSRDPEQPLSRARPFLACTGLNVAGLALLLVLWPELPPLAALAVACWGLTAVALVARGAASRESAAGFALRRRLLAARQYFAAELEQAEPRIADDWLPYLIAFELTGQIDHWFLAFGRVDTMARLQRQPRQVEPRAAGAPAPSPWTGGRGALGGAGASGAWIAATTGLTVVSALPGRARAAFAPLRPEPHLGGE